MYTEIELFIRILKLTRTSGLNDRPHTEHGARSIGSETVFWSTSMMDFEKIGLRWSGETAGKIGAQTKPKYGNHSNDL